MNDEIKWAEVSDFEPPVDQRTTEEIAEDEAATESFNDHRFD